MSTPLVIDDDTPADLLFPEDFGRGLEPGEGFGDPGGYLGYADPFADDLLIPESEWIPRIREIEGRGSDPETIAYRRGGVRIKNQGQLPYCWMFATVSGLEVVRAFQNQPHVALSPASTGAWVTGFRARGGYGKEAIEGLIRHGCCPSSLWPDADIARRHDTEANRSAALPNRVGEWWSFGRSWPAIVSCVLRGTPVSAGFNWWAHQVLIVRMTVLDGVVCPRIANSWGPSWGEEGFATLQGSRRIPDDAVAPRTAIPS